MEQDDVKQLMEDYNSHTKDFYGGLKAENQKLFKEQCTGLSGIVTYHFKWICPIVTLLFVVAILLAKFLLPDVSKWNSTVVTWGFIIFLFLFLYVYFKGFILSNKNWKGTTRSAALENVYSVFSQKWEDRSIFEKAIRLAQLEAKDRRVITSWTIAVITLIMSITAHFVFPKYDVAPKIISLGAAIYSISHLTYIAKYNWIDTFMILFEQEEKNKSASSQHL